MRKRAKNQKGFTIAELLMVVAIIGVLAAVSFVAVAPRIQSTRQARLDKTAETMYAAAQARLSEVYAFGDKERLTKGAPFSEENKENYPLYVVTSGMSGDPEYGDAYNAVVGGGAFADYESRTWAVEYDALNGIVFNVFYSDDQGAGGISTGGGIVRSPLTLVAHAEETETPTQPAASGGDGAWLSPDADGWDARKSLRTFEEKRIKQHVGWYGYGGADEKYMTPGVTNRVGNAAVSVKLHNEEILYAEVEVTIPKELFKTDNGGNTLESPLSLVIEVQNADDAANTANKWTSTTYTIDGLNTADIAHYTNAMPSAAQRVYGYSYKAGGQASDSSIRFNFVLDQLDPDGKTGLALKQLSGVTPGADINCIVRVTSVGGQIPEIADFDRTNSLFAARLNDKDGVDTVYIEYGRHLQNLNNTGKPGKPASGFDPTAPVAAVQIADIDFARTGSGTTAWADVYEAEPFVPIENNANLDSYDGQNYRISNLQTDDAAEQAGLFADFKGTQIQNVVLQKPEVKGSGDTGALAGKVSGASFEVKNCRIHGASVEGKETAGGLIGNASATSGASFEAKDCLIYGAKVTGSKDAGGLIGSAAGTAKLTNCEAVGTEVSGANVGGLIGNAAGEATVNGSSVWLRTAAAESDNNLKAIGENQKDITAGTVAAFLKGSGSTGGLVGKGAAVNVNGSYAATVLRTTGSFAGGLVGEATGKLAVSGSYADTYISGSQVGGLAGSAAASSTFSDCYAAGFLVGAASKAAGFLPGEAASLSNVYSVFNFDDVTAAGLDADAFKAADSAKDAADAYKKTGALANYPTALVPGVEDRENRYGLVANGATVAATNAYYTYGDVNEESEAPKHVRHVTGRELAENAFADAAERTALFTFVAGNGSTGLTRPEKIPAPIPYRLAAFFAEADMGAYPYPQVQYYDSETGETYARTQENDWLTNNGEEELEIDLFDRLYDAGLAKPTPADAVPEWKDETVEKQILPGENEKYTLAFPKSGESDYTVVLPAAARPEIEGYAFVGWFVPSSLFQELVVTEAGSDAGQPRSATEEPLAKALAKAEELENSLKADPSLDRTETLTEPISTAMSTGAGALTLPYGGVIDLSQMLTPVTDADGRTTASISAEQAVSVRAYRRLYAVYREEPEIELFVRLYDEKLQFLDTEDQQADDGEKDLGKTTKLVATGQKLDEASGKIVTTYTVAVGEAEAYTGYEFVGWYEPSALHTLTDKDIEEAWTLSNGKKLTARVGDQTLVEALTDLLEDKKLNEDVTDRTKYVSIAEDRKLVLNAAGDTASMDLSLTYDVTDEDDEVTGTALRYDDTAQAYRRLYAVYRNTKPHTVTVMYRFLPRPTGVDSKAAIDIYAGEYSKNIAAVDKYEVPRNSNGTYTAQIVDLPTITGYELVTSYPESINTEKLPNYQGFCAQIDPDDETKVTPLTKWNCAEHIKESDSDGNPTKLELNAGRSYTYVVLYTYAETDFQVHYIFHNSVAGEMTNDYKNGSEPLAVRQWLQEQRDSAVANRAFDADATHIYTIKDISSGLAGSSAETYLTSNGQADFAGFELRKIMNDAIQGGNRVVELHYYRKSYTLSFDLDKGTWYENGAGTGRGYKPYQTGIPFGAPIGEYLDSDDTLKKAGNLIDGWTLTEVGASDGVFYLAKDSAAVMPNNDAGAKVVWRPDITKVRIELYYQSVQDPLTVAAGSEKYELYSVKEMSASDLLAKSKTGIYAYYRKDSSGKYVTTGEITDSQGNILTQNQSETFDLATLAAATDGRTLESYLLPVVMDGTLNTDPYHLMNVTIPASTSTRRVYTRVTASSSNNFYAARYNNETYLYSNGAGTYSTDMDGKQRVSRSIFGNRITVTLYPYRNASNIVFLQAVPGDGEGYTTPGFYTYTSTTTPIAAYNGKGYTELFPFNASNTTAHGLPHFNEDGELVVGLYYDRSPFQLIFCANAGNVFTGSANYVSGTAPYRALNETENTSYFGEDNRISVRYNSNITNDYLSSGVSSAGNYRYRLTITGRYNAIFNWWPALGWWQDVELNTASGSISALFPLGAFADSHPEGLNAIRIAYYGAKETGGETIQIFSELVEGETDGGNTARVSSGTAAALTNFKLTPSITNPVATSIRIYEDYNSTPKKDRVYLYGYEFWKYYIKAGEALTHYNNNSQKYLGTYAYNASNISNMSSGLLGDDSLRADGESRYTPYIYKKNSNTAATNFSIYIFLQRKTYEILYENVKRAEGTVQQKDNYLYQAWVSSLPKLTAADCPYGSGFLFDGWYVSSDYSDTTKVSDANGNLVRNLASVMAVETKTENGVTSFKMPANSLSFVAKWKPEEVKVTYHMLYPDTDGTYDYTPAGTESLERNSQITATDPEKVIALAENGGKAIGPTTGGAFVAENGGLYYKINKTAGEQNKTWAWRFDGWYYNDADGTNPALKDLTQAYNNALAVGNNMDLYAKWTQTAGDITIYAYARDIGTEALLQEEPIVIRQNVDYGSDITIYAPSMLTGPGLSNYWPVFASYTFQATGDKAVVYMYYDHSEAWEYKVDCWAVYTVGESPVYIKITTVTGRTDSTVAQIPAPSVTELIGYRFAAGQTDFINSGGYATQKKPDAGVTPQFHAFYTVDGSIPTYALNGDGTGMRINYNNGYYSATTGGTAIAGALPAAGNAYSRSIPATDGVSITVMSDSGTAYSLKEVYTLQAESDGSTYTYTREAVEPSEVTWILYSAFTDGTLKVRESGEGNGTELPGGTYRVTRAEVVLVSESGQAIVMSAAARGTVNVDKRYAITLKTGNPDAPDKLLYYDPHTGEEQGFYENETGGTKIEKLDTESVSDYPVCKYMGSYTLNGAVVLTVNFDGTIGAPAAAVTGSCTLTRSDTGRIPVTVGGDPYYYDLTDGKFYLSETGEEDAPGAGS